MQREWQYISRKKKKKKAQIPSLVRKTVNNNGLDMGIKLIFSPASESLGVISGFLYWLTENKQTASYSPQ